jgi:hypothetical protein
MFILSVFFVLPPLYLGEGKAKPKLPLYLIKCNIMKINGRLEVYLNVFLMLAGWRSSNSCFSHYPEGRSLHYALDRRVAEVQNGSYF